MQNFYFTFGSNELFPYQNGYLIVIAENLNEAILAFRKKHKDRSSGYVNCSFFYSEDEWEKIKVHYGGQAPKEIIIDEMIKQKRLVELLENAMNIVLQEVKEFDLLWSMGTTKMELAELGVDVEEVFG